MGFGQNADKPKSLLGYHRLLAPSASVRVSPLCLGAMNFGDAWESFMGKCDKKTSFEILDFFYESGGNFIDTSNNYQDEESEIWIGEWMAKHGNRDEMVVATKFTTGYKNEDNKVKIKVNYQGNSTKSLHLSVEASLKKLQTTYIDLLYVHWWDFSTSVEELMQSLDRLVKQGKVLYLGVSDTPAWIVSKANQYARDHGLRQFSVYQGKWNAADRDMEREIIPMTVAEGMGIAPWKTLGGGDFKPAAQFDDAEKEGRKLGPRNENAIKVSGVLEKMAKAKGSLMTSVAMAYVMAKTPYVFPIVGGRKIDHLKGNIEALSLELSAKDIEEIEDATDFDIGFPMNFLFNWGGATYNNQMTTKDIGLVKLTSVLDTVPPQQAIKPHGL